MKSRPTLKDLLKELDSIVTWQLLMINLGGKKSENDKIEINFRCDIDRQKQEAFDKWLRRKPGACWKDVIDALYEMKEVTLASRLSRKYDWKDPRVRIKLYPWYIIHFSYILQVYVSCNFLSASYNARITARKIGDIPYRRFLPPLDHGLEYYTVEDESVQQMKDI